jgi:hypothetical protein
MTRNNDDCGWSDIVPSSLATANPRADILPPGCTYFILSQIAMSMSISASLDGRMDVLKYGPKGVLLFFFRIFG